MNERPFDDEIEALLQAERGRPLPDADLSARVLSRLETTLGPLDGGGGGGSGGQGGGGAGDGGHSGVVGAAPAAAGTASAAWLFGVKPAVLALTFALGGATGAVVHSAVTRPVVPPPAEVVEARREPDPAPRVEASAPPRPAPSPAVSTSAPAIAAPSAPREAKDAPTRDLDLAGERALIEMARSAMARGQDDAAISALQRHAAKYPRGQMAEERESLLVHALAASGNSAAAREKAAAFRKQFPGSLQTPAVDGALDGGTP